MGNDDPFAKLARLAQARAQQAALEEKAGGSTDIDDVFERLRANREKTAIDVTEMDRILVLPVQPELPDSVRVEISRRMIDARHFDKGFRLLNSQADAIYAFDMCNGGFFTIGVGRGKAGISMLCADIAYKHKEVERSMLFVPPSVYAQTMLGVVPMWRRVANLSVPMIGLGGKSKAARMALARSGKRGCYVMPYSLLSRSDALEILGTIRPQLVIADEAHAFKNRKSSARTKKFLKWVSAMREHYEPPMMVVMSGTMSCKGISDYHHLIDMALGDGSPLPRQGSLAYFWGQMLDSSAEVCDDTPVGSLIPLVRWAASTFPDAKGFDPSKLGDLRKAYRLRLNSTPGVVSGGDKDIGTSITLCNKPVADASKRPGWAELMGHFTTLEEAWLTPDGDEIECAINLFKWKQELSAGFYNSLYWPEPVDLARRQSCTEGAANSALTLAQEWHAVKQDWAKELREFIKWSPAGLDTPMEVVRQIVTNPDPIPVSLVDLHNDLSKLEALSMEEFGFFVERWSRVVRVCDFKVNAALRWAEEFKAGGIIWCYNKGIAAWVLELLNDAGLSPVNCPAGANETICKIGDPDRGGKGDRLCVASMSAHGLGKNLQAFQNQFYVQWPRFANLAEQSLGRLHREGQKADHLDVHTCNTLPCDEVNFAACLNDAVYAQQTLGTRQKIVYCDYDPAPRIYSTEFLREQGADPKKLSREMREMMEAKFGTNWEDLL